MKTRSLTLFVLLAAASVSPLALGAEAEVENLISSEMSAPSEDWKGEIPRHDVEVGALTGLGVFDGNAGYTFLVNGAKSLDADGFIDGVDDRFLLEAYLGPTFLGEGTAFDYGAHARWDFNRNSDWSFYATGGLAGTVTGEALGDAWRLVPRFAAGVFRSVSDQVRLRAEVSHNLITVGASYGL